MSDAGFVLTTNALLVEDKADDQLAMKVLLELMGLVVYCSSTRQDALAVFALREYCIVVMHLGHSRSESMQLCRSIRAESNVPIIMLTHRNEQVDEQMMMDAGADDYAAKPIVERIFTARVTQQLKRGESQRLPRTNLLTWGSLEMDLTQHLFSVDHKEVSLTNAEYQFLQLLMANPKQIFSREQIIDSIGSFRGLNSDHLVDTHASRIRKKIRDANGPEVISVIRSVGFRLASS